MTKDEALKLALEALQWNWGGEPLPTLELQAINAIKEALAQSDQESDDLTIAYMSGVYAGKNKDALQRQPEQEPVAMRYDFDGYGWSYIDNGSGSNWREKIKNAEPLYTASPQRKPLTRQQIREIEIDVSLNISYDYITPAEQLCRAIEAAHGIKSAVK